MAKRPVVEHVMCLEDSFKGYRLSISTQLPLAFLPCFAFNVDMEMPIMKSRNDVVTLRAKGGKYLEQKKMIKRGRDEEEARRLESLRNHGIVSLNVLSCTNPLFMELFAHCTLK